MRVPILIAATSLGLLLGGAAPLPEAEATSHAAFIAGPEWRKVVQRTGMCYWWEIYERDNVVNPMSYAHRWAFQSACYPGTGLLLWAQWGFDLRPLERSIPEPPPAEPPACLTPDWIEERDCG